MPVSAANRIDRRAANTDTAASPIRTQSMRFVTQRILRWLGNFIGRPTCHHLRQGMHHHMQMIAQHRIAPFRHAEDASQFVDPILHPLAAILEGTARAPILAAEKGAAHAARDAVKSAGRTGCYQNRAGIGHGTDHRPGQSSCQLENGASFGRRFPTKWVSVVAFLRALRGEEFDQLLTFAPTQQAQRAVVGFGLRGQVLDPVQTDLQPISFKSDRRLSPARLRRRRLTFALGRSRGVLTDQR